MKNKAGFNLKGYNAWQRKRILRACCLIALGILLLFGGGMAVGYFVSDTSSDGGRNIVSTSEVQATSDKAVTTSKKTPTPAKQGEECEIEFADPEGLAKFEPIKLNAVDDLYRGKTDPAHAGDDLPLPTDPSGAKVFAGWFDEKAQDGLGVEGESKHRINGAMEVNCIDGHKVLKAKWIQKEAASSEAAGANKALPILMYHQFAKNSASSKSGNQLSLETFDKQMAFLESNHYYFPTWREVEAFVDGKIVLPKKSVVVTDDDADATWIFDAVPIVEKHKVLATSFVITVWRHEPTPSKFVLQRSHTNDLHTLEGKNGRMVVWDYPRVLADLKESVKVLRTAEVIAYPYGHNNETARKATADAGFKLAVTTAEGKVKPGATKLQLPRMRVSEGQKWEDFLAAIS